MDLGFITVIVNFIGQYWPTLFQITAYLVVLGIPTVSILIELAELITMLTTTKKDNEAVSKVKSVWQKIIPYLEVLPHVNIPLAPMVVKVFGYVNRGVKAVITGIKSWFESEEKPAA